MDPDQVTQVFQRCPACRTPVSPTDARCPKCGRSLQDVVENTMPMPRLGADADPIAAPDATIPLPWMGHPAGLTTPEPSVASPDVTMPLPRLGDAADASSAASAQPVATPDVTVAMPTIRPTAAPPPAVVPEPRATY